jgi:hypothetical protein
MYALALSQDKRRAQTHFPVSNGRVKRGFSPFDFFWDDFSRELSLDLDWPIHAGETTLSY